MMRRRGVAKAAERHAGDAAELPAQHRPQVLLAPVLQHRLQCLLESLKLLLIRKLIVCINRHSFLQHDSISLPSYTDNTGTLINHCTDIIINELHSIEFGSELMIQ